MSVRAAAAPASVHQSHSAAVRAAPGRRACARSMRFKVVNNPLHIAVLHRRKERQGEDVAADVFRLRKIAGLQSQALVQREQVHGRIMHAGADAGRVHLAP